MKLVESDQCSGGTQFLHLACQNTVCRTVTVLKVNYTEGAGVTVML